MKENTAARWVQPIAYRDREARAELLRFARSVPEDAWSRKSLVPGWTCRDLLAHLAGDTGKWFAGILRSVLDSKPLDGAAFGPQADIDAINQKDVDERRSAPLAALIAEINSDGREHDALLSSLTDADEARVLAHYAFTLGEFLRDREAGNRGGHDKEHLAQLRAALEGGAH